MSNHIVSKNIEYLPEMAGADIWVSKNNLNTARGFLTSFSLNGYGYTAGGGAPSARSTTEQYNDDLDLWVAKADLNERRLLLAGFSLDNYGYTAGGQQVSSDMDTTEQYSDVQNVWTQKSSMTVALKGLAGFSLHNYGYTVGGAGSNYTERYNATQDLWIEKADLNYAHYLVSGFSLRDFGYAVGGTVSSSDSDVAEQYNDISNVWTIRDSLNTARSYLSGVSLNNFGYTVGGYTGGGTSPSSVTEQYNDIANLWSSKFGLNTARETSCFALNGMGYAAAGNYTALVEQYSDCSMYYLGTLLKSPNNPKKVLVSTSQKERFTNLPVTISKLNLYPLIIDTVYFYAGHEIDLLEWDSITGGSLSRTTPGLNGTVAKFTCTAPGSYVTKNLTLRPKQIYRIQFYMDRLGSSGGEISTVLKIYNGASNIISLDYLSGIIPTFILNVIGGGPVSVSGGSPATIEFKIESYIGAGDGYCTISTPSATSTITGLTNYTSSYRFTSIEFGAVSTTPWTGTSSLDFDEFTLSVPHDDIYLHMESNKDSFLKTGETLISKLQKTSTGFYTYGVSVGLPSLASSVGGDFWSTVANFGTAVYELGGFSLNSYGYALGGYGAIASPQRYNDKIDAWESVINPTYFRGIFAGFTLNGFGYIAGGYGYGSDFTPIAEKYNITLNSWSNKDSLNTSRDYLMSGFSLNGFGYVADGYTGTVSNITEKYDDIADTWSYTGNDNEARRNLWELALNGFGYTIGGYISGARATVDKYNDTTGLWDASAAADLGTGTAGMGGFTVYNRAYIAGGDHGAGGALATTLMYDDKLNNWTAKSDMPVSRTEPTGFSINRSGFIVAGNDASSVKQTSVQKYNIALHPLILGTTLVVEE